MMLGVPIHRDVKHDLCRLCRLVISSILQSRQLLERSHIRSAMEQPVTHHNCFGWEATFHGNLNEPNAFSTTLAPLRGKIIRHQCLSLVKALCLDLWAFGTCVWIPMRPMMIFPISVSTSFKNSQENQNVISH